MTRHDPLRADLIAATIAEYRLRNGYGPTVRELSERCGLASTSAVHHHLLALRKQGRVTWVDGRSRSLSVVGAVGQDTPEALIVDIHNDRGVGSLSPEVQDRLALMFRRLMWAMD